MLQSIQRVLIAWNPGFGTMRWQNWVGCLMLAVPLTIIAGLFILYAVMHHPIVTFLVTWVFTALILAPWKGRS